MKYLLSLFLVFTISVCSFADDIEIVGPSGPIPVGNNVRLVVKGLAKEDISKAQFVYVPDDPKIVDAFSGKTWQDEPYIVVRILKPGTEVNLSVSLNAFVSDVTKASLSTKNALGISNSLAQQLMDLEARFKDEYPSSSTSITIRSAGLPVPDPDDPPVDPPVTDLPIEGTGLRVLVLLEEQDIYKYSLDMRSSLNGSTAFRYLLTKCVGGQTGFRRWDDDYTDADLTRGGEDPVFIKAYNRAKTDAKEVRPWLLISNGKEGYSGPMPAPESKYLELLKKYGGN